MAFDSFEESSFVIPQEKSSWPSIGSVLDGYLIKNCSRFGNSYSLCGFNENLEGEACFEMINFVLGDLDDAEDVVVDDDVLDRLPMDPFGMNIESTLAALSGWRIWSIGSEDGEFGVDETHEKIGDHDRLHFLDLSWGWNGPENFQPQRDNSKGNETSVSGDVFDGYQTFDGMFGEDIVADGNGGGFLSVSHGAYWVQSSEAEESQNCTKIESEGTVADGSGRSFLSVSHGAYWVQSNEVDEPQDFTEIEYEGIVEEPQNFTNIECDAEGGPPHDALFFVLAYLGVRDLLSVEWVCRSLCDAVRGDPLLWRTVQIDQPLNGRITDDTLVKLTNRAQGTLECLILLNCLRITDNGLGRVVQSNSKLMKLIVPDCIRLTIEGVLFNLKALKSSGKSAIKCLRIGGLDGVRHVTDQQLEELKQLLDASKQGDQKPQFFGGDHSHMICEDDRAIDIDLCPRCKKVRPVYDCPVESCQQKHEAPCRGCTICISRCTHCGRCIKDFDHVETFCLDILCLDCIDQFLNCQEKGEKEPTKCTIISQRTMYRFCLYG